MSDKAPPGAKADYFQVLLKVADLCGHPHESIECGARCIQKVDGATVVAIKMRKDTIGTAKLYVQDYEYSPDPQVQQLIKWKQNRRN